MSARATGQDGLAKERASPVAASRLDALPPSAALEQALGRHGLIVRGRPVTDRTTGLAVVLVGQVGGSAWPHFQRWWAANPRTADPLDTWSRGVIGAVADIFGARAVSPSDRPYRPFQQWAMQAEGLKPSPLGILMHPRYGLWHAYRGALLFDAPVEREEPIEEAHLCATCAEKPCLRACPVEAFSGAAFDVVACRSFLDTSGGYSCMKGGCAARNACPYGAEYRYLPDQLAFHMQSFAHR